MHPKCLKFWVLIFSLLCLYVQSEAQCFSFAQSQIPPNSSFVVPLVIEGAALDDLSDIDQCVEAVALSFSHPRVSELEIFLISPFGDTIALVSGGGGTFAATNNTNWSITFVPCNETAFPDVDFNPNFTNSENWGVFGNYFGLYYPFEDCLEDFDEGPVNGTWQLLIVNNSAFNAGTLTGFSLFFCNGDGLDCFICQATQSTISLDNYEFCRGSSDLLLDINRTFVGLAPDPSVYGYEYLLFQDSILTNSGSFLDLRDSSGGDYKVCGLSYLLEDSMSIIMEGDKIDFDLYRSTLTSDTAEYCGRLSNCIDIRISEPIDTVFTERFICRGDTLFVGLDTIVSNGLYDIAFPSAGPCDSIVQIDLNIIDFELESDIDLDLDCNNSEQTLFPVIISSTVDPSFLNYIWTGPMGDTLSLVDSLVIVEPGIYTLSVYIIVDGDSLCTLETIYSITLTSDEYDPEMVLPDVFCPDETYELTLSEIVSGTSYSWIVTPMQDIVGPSDSTNFTFIISGTDDLEICVLLENECFQDTTICNRISINQVMGGDVISQDTVCGLNATINTTGLNNLSAIVVAGPSMNVDFDIMDSDIVVSVTESGEYIFEVLGFNNGCSSYTLDTIYFLGLPNISFEVEVLNDCIDPRIFIVTESLGEGTFQLFGSFNGLPFEFTIVPGISQFDLGMVLEGENSILLASYQYTDFPSCSVELSQGINVDLSPILIFPDLIQACNEINQELETIIDLSGIFNYAVDIISISSVGFEGEIMVPNIDFSGVSSGHYDFEVIIDPGNGCPVIDTIIQISVQDCACPFLVGGNIIYDFCGLSETDLNSFVAGEWQIVWEIVSTPTGSVLSLDEGVLDFDEFRPGLYEFTGVVQDVPEGCDPVLSLVMNATDLFNPGELILDDTLYICLEGVEDQISLFDYIQNFDSDGQWRLLTHDGLVGSLDILSGSYMLSGFGKSMVSFSYGAAEDDDCSLDSIIIHIVIYRHVIFDVPQQFDLTCTDDIIEIDIGRFIDVEGWALEISAIEGAYELSDDGRSIIVNRESLILFSFIGEGDRCNYEYEVSITLIGNPISDLSLNVMAPLCIAEDGEGIIEVTEIIGGAGPYTVQLNGLILTEGPFIFSDLVSGNYLLQISDVNGCTLDSMIRLETIQVGYVTLGDDIFVTSGSTIDIDFESDIPGENIASISWALNGDILCEGCMSIQVIAAQGQMVSITLIDLNGCVYRDSLFIFADIQVPFYLPNAFSPNFDNINEKLFIYPRAGLVEVLEWKIFDRWGSAVFESGPFNPFNQEIGWDGQHKGRSVLPGIYVSTVKYLLSNGRSSYHVSEVTLLK